MAGEIAGARLREIAFLPTFQKHEGRTVRGFHIHIAEPEAFRPVLTAVSLLSAVRQAHPEDFAWSQPPYEYETSRPPIDFICGTDRVRAAIDGGIAPEEIAREWRAEVEEYRELRRDDLLYR
jgi:uncharacterized protein YbbC (DUF1343 family)